MQPITELYRHRLTLLTDFYQLTMAYGYWKSGTHTKEAVFNLFFRKVPFSGGFALSCGLTYAIDFLQHLQFGADDLAYLSTLTGSDGKPLFESAFLDYLGSMEFQCDIDAVPEGTVVFPHEPIMRITGPIMQCQLLETTLLNIINFQTLIATKAARIKEAAGTRPVIEFGLRRAQGVDGALTASWAAHIGGCDFTSNVLAGKVFGIPLKGTHAHSWVMSFDSELEAFQEYAKALPNNCVFLVDTYDTLQGVRNAIEVGRTLAQSGHKLLAIRLDSGDLAYLSQAARELLDQAGLVDTQIIASNDLDENIIASLNLQDAPVGIWGVGTKLVTAYDQPALGGVYKLAAVREPGGQWQHKVKLSEQSVKVSTPGIQQIRRFRQDGKLIGDAIFEETMPPAGECIIVDPLDMTRRKVFSKDTAYNDLLVPIFRSGKLVYDLPDLGAVRQLAQANLSSLHSGSKRLLHPHQYPVGLELHLHDLKTRLIMEARGLSK